MTAQTKRQRVACTLLICLIAIAIVLSGWIYPTVHADDDLFSSYDKTNAYDDLKSSVIGGEAFDLADYPKDANGTPRVILFTEYCYSTLAEQQAYFGLYVYIYNPGEWTIDSSSVRNRIQMRIGTTGEYAKYSLTLLNYSTDKSCEKRFYKFRVSLSYAESQAALKKLDGAKRVYEIVGVELSYNKVVKDYACAQTYTYSGYAAGCNPYGGDENTLTCAVDGLDKYLNLEVKHTEYRAEGDYYNGEQSQLNSVYFRVPNKYFKDYGELTEIACEWWEYFTKPMLIVENKNRGAASAINSLYGRNMTELDKDKYGYYLFSVFWANIVSSWFVHLGVSEDFSNYNYAGESYNFDFLWHGGKGFPDDWKTSSFAAAFTVNSLDDYYVSGETVQAKLLEHSEKLGGKKVRDRYSEALFENYVQSGYDRGHNQKSIKADDEMPVFWNTTTKSTWQKMFTGTVDVNTEYDYLKAIVAIGDNDLNGTNSEISNELYINERDVDSLKAEHAKAKRNDETVVLFRFSTTKYFCAPGVYSHCAKDQINSGTSDGEILVNNCWSKWKDSEWNCAVACETVYLDFDIISLTYTSVDAQTVIPVVASPIDIIGGLTPPLEDPWSKDGDDGIDWRTILKIVLGVIIGLCVLWLLSKLGVFKLIAAPFKMRKNKSDSTVNVNVNVPNTNKKQSEDK